MRTRSLRRLGGTLTASALTLTVVPGFVGGADAAVKFAKAPTGASITSYKWLTKDKSRFDFTVKSPSLGNKSVKVRVLLPKGWSKTAKRTWPIVYAFQGGHDSYVAWTRSTDIETVARKYGVIVAMPEGADGSYTNWYNGGRGGTPKWESFHIREVIPLMEKNFRASKTRAVMGLSSGGQGAMTYAARYPKQFKFAASFSGILSMLKPGVPTMLQYVNSGNGADPNAIWGDPVWDRGNWKLHDPYTLADQLRGTKLFFSSGTTGRPGPGDPDVAPWDIGLLSEIVTGDTNKHFRDRLKQLKIPYTAHLYGDGRHNWPAWRREYKFVWPYIMQSIGAKKA